MIDETPLSNLSLFTGAGGMEIGLEAAGFTTLACVELDDLARQTIALNRSDWNVLSEGDVNEVADSLAPPSIGIERGDLDLLSGGPPCQPFSSAAQWAGGARQGMRDTRAQTVHSLIRLVDSFLPKAVMLENVVGFVQGPNSALNTIEEGLEDIGRRSGSSYRLAWRLLNSSDYGIPQNRRRVILVALRDDLEFRWPTQTHIGDPVTAGEALAGLDEGFKPTAVGKWAGLLPSIPPGENYQWLTSRGGGVELFGYRTKYWNFLLKLDPDLPSWTLAASPGPSTGPFHWENRPLTAREMMRLQTFPDDWQLVGNPRETTRLAGNATPALLAEVVGQELRAALTGSGDVPKPKLSITRRSAKITTPEIRPVSSKFLKLAGEKGSHPGPGLGPAPRNDH